MTEEEKTVEDVKTPEDYEAYLTIEEIKDADDIPEEDLVVPEWDGKLRIRGMTAQQRLDFYDRNRETDPGKEGETKINLQGATYDSVVMGVIEPDLKEEHIPILKDKHPAVLDAIVKVFMRLSGIDMDALAEERKKSSEEESD